LVFLVFLFALASGFASLVYQILWAREFAVILGSTVHAISTVLAAFMGGLGIGSILFGRIVDQSERSVLRLYAIAEAAIAISAIVLELAFRLVPRLYGTIYNLQVAPQLFYVLRFLFAFSILLLPTLFMGATIPILAKLIARDGFLGIPAGWIYALNTIGAAAGAFSAGFFLIEQLGMHKTLAVAVAINLLIAAVAAVYDRRFYTVSKTVRNSRVTSTAAVIDRRYNGKSYGGKSPLLIYAFSGFVALGLEVVWSRTLVFSIGATTYAFSSVLVVVLAGLAIGTVLATRLLKTNTYPLNWIVAGQASIALLSLFSLVVFTSLSIPLRDWLAFSDQMSWRGQLLIQFGQTAVLLLVPAIIFGAIFPLAAELHVQRTNVGSSLGRLLAANTFASIAGSLLTGFVFIPSLGIDRSYALLGTVSFIALLYALKSRLWVGMLGAAWLLVLVFLPKHKVLEPISPTEKLIFYKEGTNGTISVVEDYAGERNLMIDHIAVAGTDPIFTTDQKSLAHLPMLLHPNPKKVLTVGFGSGGASYSFTRYPQLDAIHAVEIDPVVLEASPYFQAKNGNPFLDPRFHVIRDDARSYLLYGRDYYDIITTDCTDLRYKSNALLYTGEFFEAAKGKLRQGGMVVAWVPLGGLSAADLKTTIRTFTETFPYASGWYMYNYPTHYVLLVGSGSELRFDLKEVRARMNMPAVRQDLAEINLDDPLKLLACYFKNRVQLLTFSNDAIVNRDNAPILEFSVPRSPHAFSLSDNLEEFSREVDDPAHLVSQPVDVAAVLRARTLIVQGHIVFNETTDKYKQAMDLYQRAQALNPSDASLEILIRNVQQTAADRKREYEKLASSNPSDVNAGNELGLLRENEGDLDGAQQAFEHALQITPTNPLIHLNLGRVFDSKHDFAKSVGEYLSALHLDPDYWEAWNNLGFVYLEQENYPDAISAFEKTVALKPEKYTSWFNLGLGAYRGGKPQRAREAYDRALALNPGFAEAYLNRGILRLTNKDIDGAHSDLSVALQHRPDSAEAHYNLGIIEEQRKDPVQAALHYRRATELDPKYVLAFNNLGILYSLARQPKLAIETYTKAIAVDPNDAQLRNNIAMEYARLGNLNDAIAQYQKAIELKPRMFEPYANLALIYMRRNQTAEAQKYLSEARKLNPDLKIP
jgi:spermidine synthase